MEWLRGLEPLYRESARLDQVGLGYVPRRPTERLIDCWSVVGGIQGLDTFLTQTPSNLYPEDLKGTVLQLFICKRIVVTLSDKVSQIHLSIMHNPVIWLGDCTPEVKARWKELEQEVLRMS